MLNFVHEIKVLQSRRNNTSNYDYEIIIPFTIKRDYRQSLNYPYKTEILKVTAELSRIYFSEIYFDRVMEIYFLRIKNYFYRFIN